MLDRRNVRDMQRVNKDLGGKMKQLGYYHRLPALAQLRYALAGDSPARLARLKSTQARRRGVTAATALVPAALGGAVGGHIGGRLGQPIQARLASWVRSRGLADTLLSGGAAEPVKPTTSFLDLLGGKGVEGDEWKGAAKSKFWKPSLSRRATKWLRRVPRAVKGAGIAVGAAALGGQVLLNARRRRVAAQDKIDRMAGRLKRAGTLK